MFCVSNKVFNVLSLSRELPKLPPWNPFFSLNNPYQVNQRMKGLQEFLETLVSSSIPLLSSPLSLVNDYQFVHVQKAWRDELESRYSPSVGLMQPKSVCQMFTYL